MFFLHTLLPIFFIFFCIFSIKNHKEQKNEYILLLIPFYFQKFNLFPFSFFRRQYPLFYLFEAPSAPRKTAKATHIHKKAEYARTPLKIFANYLKNPLTISSSASFSVNPSVISLISCSPAIFPIAAS